MTDRPSGGPNPLGMLLMHREDHLGLVLRTPRHHHTGEDELIWPLLRQRAPHTAAVLDAWRLSTPNSTRPSRRRLTEPDRSWHTPTRCAGCPYCCPST